MHLLPHFSLSLNPIALFGLTLILGLIGGELAARTRFLPRITGYIAVGFLVGPGGMDIMNQPVLDTARIFVEISLSLILFDLGKHLDFAWFRHDRGLLPMGLTESGLTFAFVFVLIYGVLGLSALSAALAASIAVATSPAVVMMVIHDLSADGPVTRRTLTLTSLNNLIALLVFNLLLPFTQSDLLGFKLIFLGIYHLFGSILLGFIMFLLIKKLAEIIGKHQENQFVLFVGAVVLTMGLAHLFKLSSMMSLFTLGVAARNFDKNHAMMEVDFGWFARLFFIMLFVVSGVYLQLKGLWQAGGIVMLFLIFRLAAKIAAVWFWSDRSKLTMRQAFGLSLTLLPMAGVAIGMSNVLVQFNPAFGQQLLLIITAVVAVLNIIGPILTQIAFIKTGEAVSS